MPEARLVAVMACVPQVMFFADQLPLWLVAKSANERRVLLYAGLIGLMAAMILERDERLVFAAAPYVMMSCYLPALIIVLRKPNVGTLPDWAERKLRQRWLPAWIAGRPA